MKLLHYVSFWRKSVRLVGPSGENLQFPSPVSASEITSRYPGHRLYDSSGAAVPSHSKLKSGRKYVLTLASHSQADSRSFRKLSSSTAPEYRRARSARAWHPSLDVISEDGAAAALSPGKLKERSVRKPVARDGSGAKNRVCVSESELYKHAAPAALNFVSFAPTPFLF